MRKLRITLVVIASGLLIYLLPSLFYWSPPLPSGISCRDILVEKAKRMLSLRDGDRVVKSYLVALGKNPGPKTREGDGWTPEGVYHNCSYQPQSTFYKAIRITYPNLPQRRQGFTGGAVEIHGLPPLPYSRDRHFGAWMILLGWTDGCVMLSNGDVDEIIRAVRFPVTVEIRP